MNRTKWTKRLGFGAALSFVQRKLLKGYKFEPVSDRSACYPTKNGSWDKPELPLVLDWESHL